MILLMKKSIALKVKRYFRRFNAHHCHYGYRTEKIIATRPVREKNAIKQLRTNPRISPDNPFTGGGGLNYFDLKIVHSK
jgi:hypothetical protein